MLIPMTLSQIYEARGQMVREQVVLIQKVSEADLSLIGQSIQPVITKMKPKMEENDLEDIRKNIDDILHANLK